MWQVIRGKSSGGGNACFRVEVQGINVGNEKTTGYTMDPSFPTTYEFSGSRISLGLRAQF